MIVLVCNALADFQCPSGFYAVHCCWSNGCRRRLYFLLISKILLKLSVDLLIIIQLYRENLLTINFVKVSSLPNVMDDTPFWLLWPPSSAIMFAFVSSPCYSLLFNSPLVFVLKKTLCWNSLVVSFRLENRLLKLMKSLNVIPDSSSGDCVPVKWLHLRHIYGSISCINISQM